MRVIASHSTDEIVQVETSPNVGDTTGINGRYVIDVPQGQIPVNSSSYIQPVDGNDVSSLAFEELRARHPLFQNVVFNPLLTADDISDLDLSAILDNTANNVLPGPYTGTFNVRAQVGRGSALPTPGMAPNSAAILTPNPATTPPRPGLLITDTIDISAATAGLGAETFLFYWKIHRFSLTEDISSDFGIFNGINQPAIRSIQEIDQEPADFVVAASFDDGATYSPVSRLQSFSVANACGGTPPLPVTQIRLAFLNVNPFKIYLANYAILF